MCFQFSFLVEGAPSIKSNVVICNSFVMRVLQIISQRKTCRTWAHFRVGYVSSRIRAITARHLLFPTRQAHLPLAYLTVAYLKYQEHNEFSTFHDGEFMRLGTCYRPRSILTAWTERRAVALTPMPFWLKRISHFRLFGFTIPTQVHIYLPYSLLSAYLLIWLSGGISLAASFPDFSFATLLGSLFIQSPKFILL